MLNLSLPKVVNPELFTDAKPVTGWLPLLNADHTTFGYYRELEGDCVALYVPGYGYVERKMTDYLS